MARAGILRACVVVATGLACSAEEPPLELGERDYVSDRSGQVTAVRAGMSQAETIDALIDDLAISNQRAGYSPISAPQRATPETDRRVIARRAATQLAAYGKTAFPALRRHMSDHRQSVAFRRVMPNDVSDACFCIMRNQIFNLPKDYVGSFYRDGVDGPMQSRPFFLEPTLFDHDTIGAWIDARANRSLTEMQIEALNWLIDEEKKIGFPEPGDREDFLDPLVRRLEALKAESASAPKKPD
ncbi:MAG: hypothetical protein KDA33_11820 [Phycisphaerales bacterium]|nr:hypothetical protein [Phycisphaerales bacterium]